MSAGTPPAISSGTVMPGYGLPIGDLIARIGFEDTRELWALSRQGAEYVRANATEELIPGIALSEGALEVSNVDIGDQLIARLQMLGEDFETEVEGWQVDRVRAELKSDHYFHGVYYPKAFQIDGRKYVHGLAALARRAGARIFEDTPVVSIDPSGVRKRIVTPSARFARLAYRAGGQYPSGRAAAAAVGNPAAGLALCGADRAARRQACRDNRVSGIGDRRRRHRSFPRGRGRPVDVGQSGNHLGGKPRAVRAGDCAQDPHDFPQLGRVEIAEAWSGAIGQTVHGMPQIGQLRKGLWVASGFGRQGLNTTAMAGQLIARRHFVGRRALASVFPVRIGVGRRRHRPGCRICHRHVGAGQFGGRRGARPLSERARSRERIREARLAEANRQAGNPSPAAPPAAGPAASAGSQRPAPVNREGEGGS